MSLEVTLYTRPNGSKDTLTIYDIDKEQEEFFKGRYDVTVEEFSTDNIILYAETGVHDLWDAVEVSHRVVLSRQSCKDAFKCLQKRVEAVINRLF